MIVLIKDATVLIALCAECSLRIIESVCGPSNLVGLTSVVVLLHSQHKCCYVIVIVTIECHEICSAPPPRYYFKFVGFKPIVHVVIKVVSSAIFIMIKFGM